MPIPGLISFGVSLTVGGIRSDAAESAARNAAERARFEEFARNNPDGLRRYTYPRDSQFAIDRNQPLRTGPLVDNLTNYERAFGTPKPAGYLTPAQQADAEFNRLYPSTPDPVGDFRSVFFKPKRRKKKKKKKRRK